MLLVVPLVALFIFINEIHQFENPWLADLVNSRLVFTRRTFVRYDAEQSSPSLVLNCTGRE
jgi:hypothetical protein